jgi:hypothetical protein
MRSEPAILIELVIEDLLEGYLAQIIRIKIRLDVELGVLPDDLI